MKIAHRTSGVVRLLFVIVTLQPPLPAARPTVPRLFPVVTQKLTAPAVGGVVHAVVAVYLTESAKYASSAVTRFRRSDFIEAMYAFAFVLANFGIAIAAKMPMMTTTISSSMSVKPFRLRSMCLSRKNELIGSPRPRLISPFLKATYGPHTNALSNAPWRIALGAAVNPW